MVLGRRWKPPHQLTPGTLSLAHARDKDTPELVGHQTGVGLPLLGLQQSVEARGMGKCPPPHPRLVPRYVRSSCTVAVAPDPKCPDIDTKILDR